MMKYSEKLPENCPPAASSSIEQVFIVFRLVKTDPPTMDDFRSQRAEKPNANFTVGECYACGLSVFSAIEALDKARKLPRMKNRLVCRIFLAEGAGQILKTFSDPHHFTWWSFAGYDIVRQCEIVKP